MTTAELNATDATQKPQHQHDAHGGHAEHGVPLWGLFLALLALTAAEVGLFELWHYTKEQGDPLMPKFAMVVLLLVFTFPKAAIVLIYFMHLKFEKHMVVTLAIAPFIMVGIAILPMLADTTALSPRADNKVPGLGDYSIHTHGEHAEHDTHGKADGKHGNHQGEGSESSDKQDSAAEPDPFGGGDDPFAQ